MPVKIYSVPEHLPAPVFMVEETLENLEAREAKHQTEMLAYVREQGWTGDLTGTVFRVGIADGYAQYLVIERRMPKKLALIHLPYGDGYWCPNLPFLPVTELRRRLEAQRKLDKIFAR